MSDMEFKNDFEEEEPIVLNLILDDGEEVSCEVIGIFEKCWLILSVLANCLPYKLKNLFKGPLIILIC